MIGVVDKFNMVDMSGIDVVESQGIAVEGLFNRLLNAIQNCKYQVLYNWKFAGIPIVPVNVELVFDGEQVSINNLITVTPDNVVRIYSLETPAVIQPLSVNENGEYTAPEGTDGYSPVTVNVESSSIDIAVHRGRLAINTGVITADNNYCYTDLIPIENAAGTWYLDIARSDFSSYYIGISFFAQNGTSQAGYIRQYEMYRRYTQGPVPSAKFFRIAARVSDLQTLNMTIEGSTKLSVVNPYSKVYTLKGE